MKLTLAAASCAALLSVAAGAPALADTIDFGQFGPAGTAYASSVTGVTADGVSFTATPVTGGFEAETEGVDWHGQFKAGTPLLYSKSGAGLVALNFATAISSITNLSAQPILKGAYTASFWAYDAANNLQLMATYDTVNKPGPEGSIFAFDYTGVPITKILIGTTNHDEGFALGGVAAPAVPEPATWAVMLMGFGGVGAAMRGSRRGLGGTRIAAGRHQQGAVS